MLYYVVAGGLLLHALYWGAGFAMTIMPRPWHRFWPVLAAPAGLTLQSLVVWTAAYANLPGTNSYAWLAEIIPAALLLAALRQLESRRQFFPDLARFGGLWLAMAAVLITVVTPFARAADYLTTISLGSCDAADYAAGARVLMEFARSDRTGFLGLTEVVSVMSVDNFFDFWLLLNHFTPSALIALNASIFGREAVRNHGTYNRNAPGTFHACRFLARAGSSSLSTSVSLWIALIYGLSPVTWYAVFHVAPAQLLAAQAIALITWAGLALWQRRAQLATWSGDEWSNHDGLRSHPGKLQLHPSSMLRPGWSLCLRDDDLEGSLAVAAAVDAFYAPATGRR